MTGVNLCRAVSASGLTCGRVDEYSDHISLTHRFEDRDWAISSEDRARWGVLPIKKTKPTEEIEDGSHIDEAGSA